MMVVNQHENLLCFYVGENWELCAYVQNVRAGGPAAQLDGCPKDEIQTTNPSGLFQSKRFLDVCTARRLDFEKAFSVTDATMASGPQERKTTEIGQ